MNLKKNPARRWRLYCIIDREVLGRKNIEKLARNLYKKGADVIQLRSKNRPSYELVPVARKIERLARYYGKAFLMNDRADAALASGARGLHLGSGDFPVARALRLLNPGRIVGKTVHSLKEAKDTLREGVHYISAGPVYTTPIKRDLGRRGTHFVREVKRISKEPVFAIGGINKKNVRDVLKTGADGVCVTRASSEAKDLVRLIRNSQEK
jgi:thiamine-phosphate diphosphorylase